ncbi:MAG TPA: hypothetical protein VK131_02375 [Candidatus Acidoferrales bacterium]|nr:hypothetical protein [Candidatus Acidoferrales bacterium]
MLRSRRFREMVLLVIGVTTPLGILMVNGAAFVMRYLAQFRIGVAVCALVSSLLLNGLTAWWLLALANRSAAPLYAEYRRWAIGVAGLLVLLTSAGAGYLTYLGMSNPARLPDPLSILVATLALGLPFAVTYAGRRMAGLGGIVPVDEKGAPPRRGALRKP